MALSEKLQPIQLEQAMRIIEGTFEGVIIADGTREHLITYINQAWEKTTGWTREEVIGKLSPRILKSGKQDDTFYKKLWSTILGGELFNAEIVNKRKDGSLYNTEIQIFPIKTADGRTFYVEVSRDITERKLREERGKEYQEELKRGIEKSTMELRKEMLETENAKKALLNLTEDLNVKVEKIERDKLADDAILSSIGDGLVVVDSEGKITLINSSFEKLLGWKLEELLGKSFVEVVPMEDEAGNRILPQERAVMRVLAGKSTDSIKAYFVRKNGTRFPVSRSVAPIKKGNILGAVVVFRDITKEEELDKAKTEFIYLVSHQLRTPVSALNWIIESLQISFTGMNEKQKSYFNDIKVSIARLVKLVEDLLTASRAWLGKQPLKTQKVNLADFIRDSLKTIEPYATSKAHMVKFDKLSEVCPEIEADSELLYSVFQNLVSNAIEYSAAGTVVTIELESADGLAKISIHNDGPAIPKEEQAHLFERFFRGESVKKVKPEGTGLGLFIVKSLIEKVGGEVGFKSEEGKGTTFWFSVPCSLEPHEDRG